MNTIQKGKAGEHLVIAKLLAKGYNVFSAVADDCKVDLIYIDNNGEMKRVQVKTFYFVKNGGLTISLRKIHTNSSGIVTKGYDSSEIDEFAAVNIETSEVFLIPVEFTSKYSANIFYQTIKKNFNNIG